MEQPEKKTAAMTMRFLRLDRVKDLTGLSRSAIYATADFPRPLKLGHTNASAWVESEVLDWMRRQVEKRDVRSSYAIYARPKAS
jgi:predicted DNA-binding transcriptional regulator AlpA